MKKLHHLFVMPPYLEEKYFNEHLFVNLARMLLQEGFEITILDTRSSINTQYQMPAGIKLDTLYNKTNNTFLPISHPGARSFIFYNWLKGQSFDVVHLPDLEGIGYHSLSAKHQGVAFSDVQFVLHILHPLYWLQEQWKKHVIHLSQAVADEQEKYCIEHSDMAISPTPGIVEWWHKRGAANKNIKKVLYPEGVINLLNKRPKTITKNNHTKGMPGKKNLPKVSVCLVHYNRPHFLKQALDSLEAQTYKNFEVILVDDGSEEPAAVTYLDSLEEQFKNKKWKIIRQQNLYLGAARNTAVRNAKGKYLLFMDDDNIAAPNEIATFVAVLEHTKSPIATSVFHPFINEAECQGEIREKKLWIPDGPFPSLGFLFNGFGDANALIRKKEFHKIGGFTEIHGTGHEDWEFFAKAALSGYRIEMIPEPLFHYRQNVNSMLNTGDRYRNIKRNIHAYTECYPELASLLHVLQGWYETGNSERAGVSPFFAEQRKCNLSFMGIGAQKAGTTWVHEHLSVHPEISFPAGKEVHFWDANYNKGINWYKSLFSNVHEGGVKKYGDITPAYAMLPPDIIKQIHDCFPALRIFFIMRHPVQRAWSSALMALKRAEMKFEEASDQWFIDHFLSGGSKLRTDYQRTIKNWSLFYPQDQMLVLRYDDIKDNPIGMLRRLSKHIGIDPDFYKEEMLVSMRGKVHAGTGEKIRPSLEKFLQNLHKDTVVFYEAFFSDI